MKSVRLLGVLFIAALFSPACSGTTAVDRDNRRVLEEILTAITLKNPGLLEESAKRLKARHDAGQLTDEEYQELEAVLDKARGGDWQGAEADGYRFRKKRPFVAPGK